MKERIDDEVDSFSNLKGYDLPGVEGDSTCNQISSSLPTQMNSFASPSSSKAPSCGRIIAMTSSADNESDKSDTRINECLKDGDVLSSIAQQESHDLNHEVRSHLETLDSADEIHQNDSNSSIVEVDMSLNTSGPKDISNGCVNDTGKVEYKDDEGKLSRDNKPNDDLKESSSIENESVNELTTASVSQQVDKLEDANEADLLVQFINRTIKLAASEHPSVDEL
eukprot:1083113-Ditylum_brightwellii.AAC.1